MWQLKKIYYAIFGYKFSLRLLLSLAVTPVLGVTLFALFVLASTEGRIGDKQEQIQEKKGNEGVNQWLPLLSVCGTCFLVTWIVHSHKSTPKTVTKRRLCDDTTVPTQGSDKDKVGKVDKHNSDEQEQETVADITRDEMDGTRGYCNELIEEILQSIRRGDVKSPEMVYNVLQKRIISGTGEIFERTLSDRLSATEIQIQSAKDELQQSRQERQLKALKTIQTQWQKYCQKNQATEVIAIAVKEITTAKADERLSKFLSIIDSNHNQPLTIEHIHQLSQGLQQTPTDTDVEQICQGIKRGLHAWQQLQTNLITWIYESNLNLGFGAAVGEREPWAGWAKRLNTHITRGLFTVLAKDESIIGFAQKHSQIALSDCVEVTLILQCLQRGLVSWFDQQAYNIKAGSKLSIATFLTFAAIWSHLGYGLSEQELYSNACFQMVLQILRNFAQRPYFPLYGGIFASFSGSYLRNALDYLDKPLRQVEGTEEKARILTLLGYSQRVLGDYKRSVDFHQQALEIAVNAGDKLCQIANLNHLSRTYVTGESYSQAIYYSQRALILSRQTGDTVGEANALINLGYSQVMEAQAAEAVEPEIYPTAINYLQQGLKLSQKLDDLQSKALCLSSLGLAYLVISQPESAITHLEDGFEVATICGDLYLQGLNLAHLSQAYYHVQNLEKAVYTGAIGMYLLKQIGSKEWRQTAGLLTILQGQMGIEGFKKLLSQHRSKIISIIGVDGYDYIPELLAKYRESI